MEVAEWTAIEVREAPQQIARPCATAVAIKVRFDQLLMPVVLCQGRDVAGPTHLNCYMPVRGCHFGQSVEVLVNVVGIAHESPAHLLSLLDWGRMLKVNLTSMFLCSKHVLPAMLAAREGAIAGGRSGAAQCNRP